MFNKTAKKLFISSLTLVFAAATAISSTYAWFTVQTTAKVSQIDINVTSGKGFEIRFGGKGTEGDYNDSDYKQTLSMADFEKAYPGILTALELNHVTMLPTAVEGVLATGDEMLTINEDVYATATENVDYLEFEIFFRGRDDYDILLESNKTFGWSTGMSMIVPSIFLPISGYKAGLAPEQGNAEFIARNKAGIVSGDTIFAFAADAARMSLKNTTGVFVPGTVEPVSEPSIESEYREPQIVKFTDGYTGNVGYGDDFATDVGVGGGHTNYALEYYNEIRGSETGFANIDAENENENYFLGKAKLPSATAGSLVKLVNEFDPSAADLLDAEDNPSFYGKLQVRVWLEGWDSDCFNAIFGDQLSIELGFKTTE